MGNTHDSCLTNLIQTRQVLQSIGFVINERKSSTTPQTICKYLGFIIDSEKFQISLPERKRNLIKHELLCFKKQKRCTIRSFARPLGLLTSACPAMQYGWLYTKQFERVKYLALLKIDDYNSYLTLPLHLQNDFNWW